MTSTFPDPQGTGALPIVVVAPAESAARHRGDTYLDDSTVAAWIQFGAAIVAVTVAWFGGIVRDPVGTPLLLLVAVLIAAAVFTPDVDAAIRARRDDSDEVQS